MLSQETTTVVPPDAKKDQPVEPWMKIPIPELHAFHPEQPIRIELKNGLVILLEPDHELPFINGTINIRGGSRDVPADKVSLSISTGRRGARAGRQLRAAINSTICWRRRRRRWRPAAT